MQKMLHQPSSGRWHSLAKQLKKFSGSTALGAALLLGGNFYASQTQAQTIINNYDFVASSGTYTPLGASATQMPSVKADSYISPSTPIGFTFNFDGVNYTDFKVSSNGFISFSNATSSETTNNLSESTSRPIIAPLWDDLDGSVTGSNASYEVTGTAGSRVFTFEWRNWEWNWSASAAVISFQVKLYEGSNKIEFVYQPESGSVNSGSASIGLAGAGSGPTNFLSLSSSGAAPTVNYFTETTNINTKPAAGQVYTFNRVTPGALDVMAAGMVLPVTPACIGPNQTIQVTIKNNGSAPLNFATTPVSVTSSATLGSNVTNFPVVVVNTGTLAPGATQNVTVSTTFDMTTIGSYTFNATATVAGDGRTINDALAPVTKAIHHYNVAGTTAFPQTNFNGFNGSNLNTLFPNWIEQSGAIPAGTTSSWTSDDFGNVTTHAKGISAKNNLYSTGKQDWLVAPKVIATATTAVKYDLALTVWNATTATTLGTDDELKVMVSTDCGATWTTVRTHSANTPISNTGQTEIVPLGAYAGQEITVAFLATDGIVDDPQDNDLFLDNIFIGTPPVIDLSISGLVAPASVATTPGCYTTTQNVIVTLHNALHLPIDLAVNPATITVNVTGAVTQTLTATVNSGTLAPNTSQNVTVGTLNMSAAGTYTINSSVSVANDGNPVNDAMPAVTRTVTPVVSLPQNLSFTGFNGTNLTTVFPNWKEQAGTTVPSGTTSSWSNSTGLGGATNVTARINLWSTSKNEWIVGPKVAATAHTFFKFKAAITDYNNLNPYTGTMDSDDKVQVMVSTNCGETFTSVFTLDASNTATLTNVLTEYTVPLSTYDGQQIIIALKATEGTTSGTQDYDVHVDDFAVVDMPPLDLGAVALTSPVVNTGCYGNAEPVSFTIRNFGATAIDFTATPATVTVSVTGAVTQTFPLTLSNNTLNGGAPLAANATLTIPLGTLNMQTLGTYTFNGDVAIANDGNATNNTITANITVVAPVAGTISTSMATLCNSGTSTLTLTGNNGGNIQWQQATTLSGPYTDIAGATGQTYTTGNLTATTYYQAVVSCGSSSATTTPVTITVNAPLVTASSGATVCSGGTATISATPSTGAAISWYSAATGGTPLATGNTYSAVATGPVTYYAQASIGSTSGLTSLDAHPFTGGVSCGGGHMFNINPVATTPVSTITITGFTQNLNTTAGTSVTVNIHYKTGSYLGSETTASAWTLHQAVTVTSAGTNNPTFIPINALNLSSGQNYGFYIEAEVAYTAITAPVTYSNADLSVEVGAGLCSSFGGVNANRAWNGIVHYTAGCPSPRVPVAITTTAATAVPTVAAATATTFCAGDSVQLTATSGVSGATFQWSMNGTAITGATAANFMALTAGSYTVVAIDNGCISAASTPITVTVNPKPATPTITQGGVGNRDLTSSAATGNQWLRNGSAIAGATAQTYTATANGNYAVVVTQNNCSSDTSAIVNITNTGVRGELAGMSVSVYPNPNKGQFNVKLIGYNQDAALELYSLTGQLIVKETAKAGNQTTPMQVKNLAAGTYLLKVVSEKGVQISKLIVE